MWNNTCPIDIATVCELMMMRFSVSPNFVDLTGNGIHTMGLLCTLKSPYFANYSHNYFCIQLKYISVSNESVQSNECYLFLRGNE